MLCQGAKQMLDNKKVKTAKSFLQRLRSDKAGNTFAMAAAAMFSIAGVIGGTSFHVRCLYVGRRQS